MLRNVVEHFVLIILAKFYYADAKLIQKAIDTSVEQQQKWDRTSLSERVDIWQRAAGVIIVK